MPKTDALDKEQQLLVKGLILKGRRKMIEYEKSELFQRFPGSLTFRCKAQTIATVGDSWLCYHREWL